MLANVKSVADINTCQILDSNNFAYSYPRIDGVDDVKNFVRFANENFKVVSISIGIKPEWQEFIDWLVDSGYKCHIITIDSAYAFFKPVAELVKYVKKKLPNTFLIVGNGHTPEFIQWLENSGADAAKIFVGTSKICKTANFTGFSNSTVSQLEKCAAAAKNILIFADGGLSIDETDDSVNLGDISKAVRFGADFVFTSAPFARCSDSIVQKNGFYSGNSTAEMKGYSDNIEGTLIKVKDSGLTLEQMTVRIVESLQSSVSYAGGNTLEALRYVDYEVVL
jgi:GMP reductase